jgi:hypothetical protein
MKELRSVLALMLDGMSVLQQLHHQQRTQMCRILLHQIRLVLTFFSPSWLGLSVYYGHDGPSQYEYELHPAFVQVTVRQLPLAPGGSGLQTPPVEQLKPVEQLTGAAVVGGGVAAGTPQKPGTCAEDATYWPQHPSLYTCWRNVPLQFWP